MFEDPGPLLADPFFARALDSRQQEVLKSPDTPKRSRATNISPGIRCSEDCQGKSEAPRRRGRAHRVRHRQCVLTRFEGFGEHMELELMVEAGMTPAQVITAATKSSAEFLGQQSNLGTLEQGKWADLIVLGADPLANIRNSRQIDAVYIAGNKVQ